MFLRDLTAVHRDAPAAVDGLRGPGRGRSLKRSVHRGPCEGKPTIHRARDAGERGGLADFKTTGRHHREMPFRLIVARWSGAWVRRDPRRPAPPSPGGALPRKTRTQFAPREWKPLRACSPVWEKGRQERRARLPRQRDQEFAGTRARSARRASKPRSAPQPNHIIDWRSYPQRADDIA